MRNSSSLEAKRVRPLRSLLVAVVALAAFATPLAWSQIVGATNSGPLPNNTASDEIQYVMDTSQTGAYLSFVPGANSQAPVSSGSWSESANNGGGCSPGITYKHSGQSTSAIMNISANSYVAGSTATIGDFKYRTGVCVNNSGGDDAIDPGYALAFSLNPTQASPINTAVIGSGRIFSEARIWVAAGSKNTAPATVTLTESLQGNPVATQTATVNQGSTVTLDSSCQSGPTITDSAQTFVAPASCNGAGPSNGFDQIEVRNTSGSSQSVAVVAGAGTSAPVLYLQNELCVGKSVSGSSGADVFGVNATITLVSVPSGSPTCKSYSQLSVTGDSQALGSKAVEFDAAPLAGSHFTVHVDWGDATYCTPDNENGVAACEPTSVTINGLTTPQTYCTAAGFPNVTQNMTVSGPANDTDIPAGTTVKSLSPTGTALTLSNAATLSETIPLTFTSGANSTQVVNVTTSAGSPTVTVPALCTTSKSYSYPSVSGTTYTDIVENWDGLTDWTLHW